MQHETGCYQMSDIKSLLFFSFSATKIYFKSKETASRTVYSLLIKTDSQLFVIGAVFLTVIYVTMPASSNVILNKYKYKLTKHNKHNITQHSIT